MLMPLCIILTAAAAIYLGLNLFLKDEKRAALIVSFLILLFFSYGSLCRFLPAPASLAVLTGIFAAGVIFFMNNNNIINYLSGLFGIASIILAAFTLIDICSYKISEYHLWKGMKKNIENVSANPADNAPNIYYIILDGYARSDTLKEIYGYNNSKFLEFLKNKGFYVASKSVSNYCGTDLSLASSLNLGYLDDLKSDSKAGPETAGILKHRIMNNKLFDILRRRGYKIAAFSSWYSVADMDTADIYITPKRAPKEFQAALIEMTPVSFILSGSNSGLMRAGYADSILYIFDHIEDTTAIKGPIFVFSHIYIPHPPFVFGQNGERRAAVGWHPDDEGNWQMDAGRITRNKYIKDYVDQLIFTNKKMEGLIDAILSKSKYPPVIIVHADHGPKSGFFLGVTEACDEYYKERFGILNAWYFPDGYYSNLYPGISPVNSFRVVLNRYNGGDYELLDDRCMFSKAKEPFDFRDVTERVNSVTRP